MLRDRRFRPRTEAISALFPQRSTPLRLRINTFAGCLADRRDPIPDAIGSPLASTDFGMQCGLDQTTNCAGWTWPTTQAQPGTLRLHDSRTFWSTLNPSSGAYAWNNLDHWLDLLAVEQPRFAVQTFAYVPCWDAPTCSAPPVASTGTNAPPNYLTASGSPTFNAFVTALVNHCSAAGHCVASYIKGYEMWNEWSQSGFWTGTALQLYQMVAPAVAIIRANVPNAVILMPSTTEASSSWQTDFATWLGLENSYGRISNWVNFHAYLNGGSGTTNTPETQWANYIGGAGKYLAMENATTGWAGTPWVNQRNQLPGQHVCLFRGAVHGGRLYRADCALATAACFEWSCRFVLVLLEHHGWRQYGL